MGPQAAGAEVIPDVEDRSVAEPGSVNENGLTAEEQAEFDAMKTGDPAPGPDEPPAEGEGDEDPSGDEPPEPAGDGEPAPAGSDKEPTAVDPNKKPPPKTVNYSKYRRELDKANKVATEAQTAAQKERDDRLKLSARIEMINEALQQQAQAPAAVAPPVDPNAPPENPFEEEDIDPNVDYAGSLQQERRRNRYAYEASQNTAQNVAVSNEDRALKDTFERDARSYTGSEGGQHFPQAYQFLKDSRLTEICITKFDKDPNDPNAVFTPSEVQEMVNTFNAEEKWVVSEAVKNKKSPAAAIMKLAKTRGFKPQAAAAPQVPAAPAAAAPAARAPAARTPAAAAPVPAADQLAQLRQNQQDGRSLSDGGGTPPSGLSAEMLLKLSDAEFAEMVDGMSQHQLETIMGRVPA